MKKLYIIICLVISMGALFLGYKNIEAKQSLSFNIKEYQNQKGTGKTVKVDGIKDQKKGKKINTLLLEDSKAVLSPYDLNDENVTVMMDVNYSYVEESNQLIVIYKGIYNNKTAAHPTVFYAISNIDLSKAKRIDDSNNIDIKKLTKAIQEGKFTVIAESDELKQAQKEYLLSISSKDYNQMFRNINFKEKNGKIILPEVFLIKKENKTTVILPTFHALGDYAEIEVNTKDVQ
ncbi:hypothetical protein [Anaeromicropila herbilytica]|uniref:Deacetylase PdaC domain-containing protein n=1 Tax=Anaeromicropila herbilytica TaxID=2785025 RepID=A0A7R7IF99_9FIRM|nr:hypothetical protein [Anaeromicropila herbilytica]BCN32959.1 hypothetical protein bsdtb5_42540 [Anaeromicropila herbilytica]